MNYKRCVSSSRLYHWEDRLFRLFLMRASCTLHLCVICFWNSQ